MASHSPSLRSARSKATPSNHSTTTILSPVSGALEVRSQSSGETRQRRRTLADVREQVAQELAIRIASTADVVEGVKVAVSLTLSKSDERGFLYQVASNLKHRFLLQEYLFAVATTDSSPGSTGNVLMFCGSDTLFVRRAAMIACSKFISRISNYRDWGKTWMINIRDLGSSSYDENALWDVVRKACFRSKMDPVSPPPGSRSIAQILSDAQSRLNRLTPTQAYDELHDAFYPMPTLLVDIRPQSQRDTDGSIEGCLVIERNDLEWKFDPRCETAYEIANRYDLRLIIFCGNGRSSSLAAISLHDIGLLNATDIVGGFEAWKAAGLPLKVKPLSVAGSDSLTLSQSYVYV